MMSIREGFLILLICFSMIGPVTSQDLPDTILDVLTLYNGNWDNKAQVEKGLTEHELFQIRIIPVDIVALRPAATVFIEGAHETNIRMLLVGVVSQNIDGTISMTRLNFTDITKYKYPRTLTESHVRDFVDDTTLLHTVPVHKHVRYGQFDTKDLANITYADLHGDKTCTGISEFAGPTTLVGEWSDCRHTYANGEHPEYFIMFNCDSFTIGVTVGVSETQTRVPVYLERNGPRYPLVRAPATYVSPCDKKSSD